MKKVLAIVLLVALLVTSCFTVTGIAAESEKYLSELIMESYTKRNDNWEPGLDEVAYYGGVITIAGMEFDRGISMHPLDKGEGNEAECVWDISEISSNYKYFSAVVGKDDCSLYTGGVNIQNLKKTKASFYVYLDDTLAASEIVQFGEYAIINVELKNASKITLKLGDGGDDIYCDCSAFADAKLSNSLLEEKDLPTAVPPEDVDDKNDDILEDNGSYEPDFTKDYVFVSDMNYSDYHAFIGQNGVYLSRDMNFYEEDLFTIYDEFDKGICMHADNAGTVFVEFDLTDLGYTIFAAYIGIADSYSGSTTMASAKFLVYVDDVEVYCSDRIEQSTETQLVTVDITGANKLTLALDGMDSNSGDWGVWGNAAIGKYATAEEMYNAIAADKPTPKPTAVPTATPNVTAAPTEAPTQAPSIAPTADNNEQNDSSDLGVIIIVIVAIVAVAVVIFTIIIIKKKKGNV